MAFEVLVPRHFFSIHSQSSVEYYLDVCEYYYYCNAITNVDRFKKILDVESVVLKFFSARNEEERKEVHSKFNSWCEKAAKALIEDKIPKREGNRNRFTFTWDLPYQVITTEYD